MRAFKIILFYCFFALLLLAFNWSYIHTYASLPFAAGWDSAGHATIGEYYAQHIFPSLWGWAPNWQSGMPFPEFYPPFFYFLLAIIYKLLPFTYLTVFKASVIIMSCSVPSVIAWLAYRLTKNYAGAGFAGLLAVVLMSVNGLENNFGITLQSSLGTGLVTQLLASILFFFWFGFFISIEKNWKNQFIAGIFLTLTFLSNIHTVIFAAVFYCIYFLTRILIKWFEMKGQKRKVIAKELFALTSLYFWAGFIPTLISMIWYLPMLFHYHYFTTMPLEFIDGITIYDILKRWFVLIIIFGIPLYFAIRKKQVAMIAVSVTAFFTFFLIWTHVEIYAPALPLHAPRWLAGVYFLSCLCVAYIIKLCAEKWPDKKRHFIIGALAVFTVFLCIGGGFGSETPIYNGIYLSYTGDNLDQIHAYAKSIKGMTLVEQVWPGQEPATSVINADLGLQGKSFVTIFREASINSVFYTPIRNSLSLGVEAWGFQSYLNFNDEFLDQNFDRHLDLAEMVGIQNFLVRSEKMKQLFDANMRVVMLKDFGNWQLYTFKTSEPLAVVPHNEPILSFIPVTFKDRPKDSFDYVRVQEEILDRDQTQFVFVSPQNKYIDQNADIQNFKMMMIGDYEYKNLDAATDILTKFSQDNILILKQSTDPLYKRLISLNNKNIHIIFGEGTEEMYDQLFSMLRTYSIPTNQRAAHIENTLVTSSNIHVDLSVSSSTTAVPVLIKQSYFPSWNRLDGEPLYLASPGFMLTWATSTIEVAFTTPHSVYWGYIVSIIGLILTGIFLRKNIF